MLVAANGMPNWTHSYDILQKESYKWGPWSICCFGRAGSGCGKCTWADKCLAPLDQMHRPWVPV